MTTKKSQQNYNWINDPPPPNEIELLNGAEFLPIGVVERKLYRLDPHWGTENYKSKVFSINGVGMFSASLELVVTYGEKTRRLTGAVTLPIPTDTYMLDPNVNSNLDATAKSECTKNAVKPIGVAFGQGLNDRLEVNAPQQQPSLNGKRKPPAVTLTPDKAVQDQYNIAAENGNQHLMKSIKIVYPEIAYTGSQKITETNA